MIEYALWIVSFISLYVTILWINVLFLNEEENVKINRFPSITIAVPALNEEKIIVKTLRSILNVDYPRDKLEVIVVNDGSTDKTSEMVEKFISENKRFNIKLVGRVMSIGTKAAPLNDALKIANGDLFGCLDADSMISKDSLKRMVCLFEDKEVGSVISGIKIIDPKNIYEKIQRLEYIFTTFIRKLMSKINTLHITPGALSLYKTRLIKKLGGFDEKNLTEDLEIALKLRYNGYKIKIDTGSISYTRAPNSFKGLWNQRVRWFRGFIYNSLKYRDMFMNKKYGLMGRFQFPLNILSLCIILLMFSLLVYEFLRRVYVFIDKMILINWDITGYFVIPSLKTLIYGMNFKLMFPIAVTLGLAMYIYINAHRECNEKWRHPFTLIIYFTVYPFLRSLHWVTAFFKEVVIKSKKEW